MDGISALMDGELDEHPARDALSRLKQDSELRERWETYHLISDALKGEPLLSSAEFSAVFAERLAAEPTVLAPKRSVRSSLTPRRVTTYALSAAASVSAAAFVAWVAMSGSSDSPLAPMQQAAANKGAQVIPASVSSDSSMNPYFFMHQGVSPSSQFQGVAPYIRSVSAVRPAEQGR